VTVSLEGAAPPVIYAFATDLYQVFLNLLRNALQAIEGTGSVTIRMAADEDWLRIAFCDTGRGIPPAMAARLFTPAFSAESGRVRASFSLFSCMAVAKKHGGDIRVESEGGRGSTFTVLLPRSLERSDPKLEYAGSVR
jgi:signal transduction histidine kinase